MVVVRRRPPHKATGGARVIYRFCILYMYSNPKHVSPFEALCKTPISTDYRIPVSSLCRSRAETTLSITFENLGQSSVKGATLKWKPNRSYHLSLLSWLCSYSCSAPNGGDLGQSTTTYNIHYCYEDPDILG